MYPLLGLHHVEIGSGEDTVFRESDICCVIDAANALSGHSRSSETGHKEHEHENPAAEAHESSRGSDDGTEKYQSL